MIIYIIDKTGMVESGPRRDFLKNLFSSRKVDSHFWNARTVTDPQTSLVLAHWQTDVTPNTEQSLFKFAESGAIIILYSGAISGATQENIGKGHVYKVGWNTLCEVLKRLPQSFSISDIKAAFNTLLKHDLLNAFAILCWCVSFKTNNNDIAKKQSSWKSSNNKWKEVLSKVSPEDLIIACGGTQTSLPYKDVHDEASNIFQNPGMSEVAKAIDWLFPDFNSDSPETTPDFAIVFKQIKQRFNLSI